MADRVEVLITGDSSGLSRAADQARAALGGLSQTAQGVGSTLSNAFSSAASAVTQGGLTTGLSSLAGGLTKIAAPLFVLDTGFKALSSTIGAVIDSWDKYTSKVAAAEMASLKLTAMFDGNAEAIANLRKLTKDLASESSFFGPGAVTNAAIVLKTFDATQKQIEDLLPAAIKLSTLFGTDLEETTRKLAIGLTGTTRGLREFGIVMKAGSSQAEIYNAIMDKAAKANGVMKTANDTLLGSQKHLAKEQGAYNKALGEFLAGPARLYNEFLAGAYSLATKAIRATMDLASAIGSIVSPKVTDQNDPMGITAAANRLMKSYGKKPKPPAESGGIPFARAEAGAEAPAAPRTTRAPRAARAVAAPQEMLGPGIELLQNYQRQQLENLINANIKAGEEQLKFTAAAEDLADERQRARNEELSRVFDEAANKLASSIHKSLLDGIDAGSLILSSAIKGEDISKPLKDAAPKVAGDIASFIPGLSDRAVSIVERATAASINIIEAIFDRAGKEERERQAADKRAAEIQQDAARQQYEAAVTQYGAAARSTEVSLMGREAAIRGAKAEAGFGLTPTLSISTAAFQTRPGEIDQQQVNALESAAVNIPKMSDEQVKKLGAISESLIKFGPGGENAVQNANDFFNTFGVQFNSTAGRYIALALTELSKKLDGGPTGAEATQLGDSARNPVYVFDVSPSKDEFSRAPRGLFFRPVGMGRAVNTGQNLAASGL